ncbi:MAG: hypothetical protein ACLQPH_04125 [Acidimicrobiales bacterium]
MSGIVDGLRSVGWQRLTAERRRPEVVGWRSNACRLAVAALVAVAAVALLAGFVACLRGSGPSAHAFSARVE